MLLSARILNAVSGVNSFEIAESAQFSQGDTLTLYFQLLDASLDTSSKGFDPPGRRYIPATGATLQCTLTNIDDAKQVSRYATAAFPADDRSVWALSVLASDGISGTSDLVFKLTEGSIVTNGRLVAAVRATGVAGVCC